MTIESISPSIQHEIGETLQTARGTANGLRDAAERIEAAALAPIPSETARSIEHAKNVGTLLGAEAVRGMLGLVSLAAHGGRLDAFSRALTLDAEAQAARLSVARAAIEAEARTDAKLYQEHPEEDAEEWAKGAWADTDEAWLAALGVELPQAWEWYLAAFMAAVRGSNGGAS